MFETITLVEHYSRAVSSVDVGGELIVRLLNDKRSLFRQLLESHVSLLLCHCYPFIEVRNTRYIPVHSGKDQHRMSEG